MRGKKDSDAGGDTPSGSTPHTRGKVKDSTICSRIAGTTPHMRGKTRSMACAAVWIGTTPRVWGKGHRPGMVRVRLRNNPAHAGKRLGFPGHRVFAREQPRTRGEKVWISLIITCASGTTPHMRGKDRPRASSYSGGDGNNPAHAGKSSDY